VGLNDCPASLDQSTNCRLRTVEACLFSSFLFNFRVRLLRVTGGIAQSVYRLAKGWTAWGSIPGGGEVFSARTDRPWDPHSLLYNGYRVFPGGEGEGKVAGAWK
jgi:hypothetical protein